MHETTITLDQFAGLLDELDVLDRCELGGLLNITGHHATLGPLVAFQDRSGMVILTERPFTPARIPDAYALETAIMRMSQCRSQMEAASERITTSKASERDISEPVKGMLTWLGVDPRTATEAEIKYASGAVAHADAMAALPAPKLVALHAALVEDLRRIAA
jgi:hypothetical protein